MDAANKIAVQAELSEVLGDVCQIQGRPTLTINGIRKLARRAGTIASVECFVAGADGQWREFLLEEKPAAAKCIVQLTNGQTISKVVKFSEFAKNSGVWLCSPEQMITKVAEAHALRQAISVAPNLSQEHQALIARPSADELNSRPAEVINRPAVVEIEAPKEEEPKPEENVSRETSKPKSIASDKIKAHAVKELGADVARELWAQVGGDVAKYTKLVGEKIAEKGKTNEN